MRPLVRAALALAFAWTLLIAALVAVSGLALRR